MSISNIKIYKIIECYSSCFECSGGGSNNCLTCKNNLRFYEGQCLDECPVGFYSDSSFICHSCPSTCLTCTCNFFFSSSSFFVSFFISSIFFFNNKNTLASNCLTCASNRSLFGGECVDQCPDGFISNNAICSRNFSFFFSLSLHLLIFSSSFIKSQKHKSKLRMEVFFLNLFHKLCYNRINN